MKWSRSEINHIKVSLDRCDAQELANELGRDKENVKSKIEEIDAKQRLADLTEFVRKNTIG